MNKAEDKGAPLLLYDGLCGFCDGTVRFILKRDAGGGMRFAPLQGSTAEEILDRHPEAKGVDSLIVVMGHGAQESVVILSDAVLYIARYLGGVWSLLSVLRVVPKTVRDWGYALFARHRYRVFGRYDACPIPTPEVRMRFLP